MKFAPATAAELRRVSPLLLDTRGSMENQAARASVKLRRLPSEAVLPSCHFAFLFFQAKAAMGWRVRTEKTVSPPWIRVAWEARQGCFRAPAAPEPRGYGAA